MARSSRIGSTKHLACQDFMLLIMMTILCNIVKISIGPVKGVMIPDGPLTATPGRPTRIVFQQATKIVDILYGYVCFRPVVNIE